MISDTVTGLAGDLLTLLPIALGIALIPLTAGIGWNFIRRFSRRG